MVWLDYNGEVLRFEIYNNHVDQRGRTWYWGRNLEHGRFVTWHS